MAVYLVHGRLGSGKTLASVGRLKEYSERGLKIAGNIDIYLEHLATHVNSKTTYIRVPDRPTAHDLMMLGQGNDTYDEENNGLLILDEIATWLNSRTWNAKGRAELIDWFVHARKYGWDIIFLVQYREMMDTQIREALAEYDVKVMRADRINIPIIGGFSKNFTPSGKPVKLPKIHIAKVLYEGVKADRWIYRAKSLYKCYDTKQVISEDYPPGSHTQLSQVHLFGRYLPKPSFYKANQKMIISVAMIMLAFTLLNTFQLKQSTVIDVEDIKPVDLPVTGVMSVGRQTYITVSDGSIYQPEQIIYEQQKTLYKVGSKWFARSL